MYRMICEEHQYVALAIWSEDSRDKMRKNHLEALAARAAQREV